MGTEVLKIEIPTKSESNSNISKEKITNINNPQSINTPEKPKNKITETSEEKSEIKHPKISELYNTFNQCNEESKNIRIKTIRSDNQIRKVFKNPGNSPTFFSKLKSNFVYYQTRKKIHLNLKHQ